MQKEIIKKTNKVIKKQGEKMATAIIEHKPEVVTPNAVQIIEKEVQKLPVQYISYSRAQLDQIKDVYAKGASDVEFANFVVVATRTGLDIFKRQIYLVPRWDSKLGKEIFTPQTGIDGYRSIAERTEAYAGNDDPIFDGEVEKTDTTIGKDKKETKVTYKAPMKATITVYKIVQGVRCPFSATARWDEYYPKGNTGYMWRQKPHVMLGKCAEALALRKAFPNVIGGVYTQEEMALQDAQIKPIAPQKTINAMFEKAKAIIQKKNDPVALQEDLQNIEASEKYNEEQKQEITTIIKARIAELIKSDGK